MNIALSNKAYALPWLFSLALILGQHGALAEDWPAWRGPNHDGISPQGRPPIRWSETENVVWKSEIPGVGHSSPIVSGNSVLLTSCDLETEERRVICFDRTTGHIRWTTPVARSAIERMHPNNTPASSTAATDGELIFATFIVDAEYLVVALDFEGVVQWERRLSAFVSRHGFTSSPTLVGDTLLLAGLQDSDESFVARLDCSTGETLWHQNTGTEVRSFSPPHVAGGSALRGVVVSGSNCTSGFDLQSGELLWRFPGPAEKTVSSIVELDDRLFVAGGRDAKLLAIDWPSKGDAKLAWTSTAGVPYVSSPILAGGDLHMVSDKGVYTRINVDDGKLIERKRLMSATSASPVFAGGHLYITDESGRTAVLKVSTNVEVVAENELDDTVFASPAVTGDELFIRGGSYLYCLREAKQVGYRVHPRTR